MKKTAMSLSLLLALLSGAMVGCADVKKDKVDGDAVIFQVGGTKVTASDILGFDNNNCEYDYLSTDEGVAAVYDAVYKILAQQNVEVTSAIEGAVKEKMDDWDTEVSNYASTNGVTERNAVKTLLEEKGFEDEAELEAYYLVEEQKAELASMYADSNTEPKLTGANGSTMLERYVANTSPMIVSQILVQLGNSNGLSNKAEISDTEVDSLAHAMRRLALGKASGNSFGNIALELSSDGSAKYKGNLGIMDTYTSFVSEFKLGLYASEIVQNKTAYEAGTYDADSTLGVVKGGKIWESLFGADGIYADYKIKSVNVASVVSALAVVYNDKNIIAQNAAGHNKEADYDAQLYPRNIVFNKYFNYPGIQYLKLDFDNIDAELKDLVEDMYPNYNQGDVASKVADIKDSDEYKRLVNNAAKYNINSDKLIVDDAGNPVVVAKSTYGIHFLSILWSALDNQDSSAAGVPSTAVQYFMYGSNATATNTYVKEITTDNHTGYSSATVGQNSRKSEIKDRVLNYVKGGYASLSASQDLYDYEIYNYYFNAAKADGKVSIANANIEKAIANHINNKVEYANGQIVIAQDKAWNSYIKSIESNEEMRGWLYAVAAN